MAIATQEVFSHTDAQVELWNVGANTPGKSSVLRNGRPGVTLTDNASITGSKSVTVGPYTLSSLKQPGVGNDKATAIGANATAVAVDGTWEFPVTGVTLSTAQGTAVYTTGAGVLTLTATDNTKFGEVNYPATYEKAAGVAPVKIGV